MFTFYPDCQLSKHELMEVIKAVNKTSLSDEMKDELKLIALHIWKRKVARLEAVCKRFYIPT